MNYWHILGPEDGWCKYKPVLGHVHPDVHPQSIASQHYGYDPIELCCRICGEKVPSEYLEAALLVGATAGLIDKKWTHL